MKLPRMNRKQAVAFLNENGYPIAYDTFITLLKPSHGTGPKPDCVFNGQELFTPKTLIAWAKSLCEPYPGRSKRGRKPKSPNSSLVRHGT